MKRLIWGASAALLALAASPAALTAVSEGTRLTADVRVAQVGPTSRFDPTPMNYPDARIRVKALDVDPSPPICSTCPTADVGSLVYDAPEYAFRSDTIDWIDVQEDGSVIVSAGGYSYRFVDGGKPGRKEIGPPGPTGVAPTLDSVTVGDFAGVGPLLEGSVRHGEITIRTPETGSTSSHSTHVRA